MFVKYGRLVRTCAVAIMLQFLAAPLLAEPTECSPYAQGTTSGDYYTLTGTTTMEVTRTVQLSAGICDASASVTETTTETFNAGYYTDSDGNTAIVNCSTGRVLGWL